MKVIRVLLFVWLWIGLSLSNADTIKLKDGTQLTGTIQSMSNGVYTIHTQSLGTLSIPNSQILSISKGSAGSQPGNNQFSNLQAETYTALQRSITQDQEAMAMIMKLQNDPDVQSILTDPAIMNAISRGDFSSLVNNPKIKKLMNNRDVQAITKRYSQ